MSPIIFPDLDFLFFGEGITVALKGFVGIQRNFPGTNS
jgi:hypothetical protein